MTGSTDIHHAPKSSRLHRATGLTMVVDVFKTNVHRAADAQTITAILIRICKSPEVSIDLGDCDKVLRIARSRFPACEVMEFVKELGFACEELTD